MSGFTPNDLFLWLAIAAAIVAGANQGIDLFRKLTDSKADKPSPASDHLITREVLDEELTAQTDTMSDKIETVRGGLSQQITTLSASVADLKKKDDRDIESRAIMHAELKTFSGDLRELMGALRIGLEEMRATAARQYNEAIKLGEVKGHMEAKKK